MGFLDKAKEAANQAMAATQQAAAKGQDKVTAMQQGRTEAQLYAALGQAFYAEQRHGASTQGVVDGLAALDSHFAEVARAASAQQQTYSPPPASTPFEQGSTAPGSFPPPTPPSPPAAQPGPPPAGNFTVDDL
jgi:hypothetical protein